MKERGFFCIARGFLDHPRFRPGRRFTNAEAMIWLIESAAFKEHDVLVVVGRQRCIATVQRGQMTYAIRYLAKAWGWSSGRVVRFLKALESDFTIETQTDTQRDTQTGTAQTIITLCNYAKYQLPLKPVGTHTDTQTDTQSGTATDTNKKEGKGKNKDIAAELEGGFLTWYNIYPRKTAKQDARKAYRKLMAGGAITHAELMQKTRVYAAHWKTQPAERQCFIPYPTKYSACVR